MFITILFLLFFFITLRYCDKVTVRSVIKIRYKESKMKLVRYGTKNAEKPGVIDGGGILRDLSNEIDEITPNIISPSGLKSLLSLW